MKEISELIQEITSDALRLKVQTERDLSVAGLIRKVNVIILITKDLEYKILENDYYNGRWNGVVPLKVNQIGGFYMIAVSDDHSCLNGHDYKLVMELTV